MRLADTLVRLTHVVQHEFADASRAHGVTPQQAQLLCVLIEGRRRMSLLSQTLHLEKSSLTGLVDRTVQRGLVERVADASDARACQVRLTRAGRRLGQQVHDAIVARLDELALTLPAAERQRLAGLVGHLIVASAARG